MEYHMSTGVFDLGLSQSIPWFGTLQTKKDEAARQADARYQVFLKARNDFFYDVKSEIPGTGLQPARSEEHTSELQSLMRTSYAVFCLNKLIQYSTTSHLLLTIYIYQPTQ